MSTRKTKLTARTLLLVLQVVWIGYAQPRSSGVDLEPRRVESDPLTVFGYLQSSLPTQIQRGYALLGFNAPLIDAQFPPLADLRYVQLDEDRELEVVLTFQQRGVVITSILDKQENVWWRTGQFTNGWRNLGYTDQFVEIKDVIEAGRSELLVRRSGGGTDISETNLVMYRLRSGRLRPVFQTREVARYRVVGSPVPGTTLERVFLDYPDRVEAGAAILVVDRMSITSPNPPLNIDGVLRHKGNSVCEAFHWDRAKYEFVQNASATEAFCP
ncbi:MAG: hypothetical protein ACRD8O_20770 [Bryobacteraceae bacterium]